MAELTKPLIDPDKILNEVFSDRNIKSATELNPRQIEAINKLHTLATVFNNKLMLQHTKDYMTLLKSKDRKSMVEFVDALRSKKEEYIKKAKNFAMFG